jgi:AraC family transcriptional regulator
MDAQFEIREVEPKTTMSIRTAAPVPEIGPKMMQILQEVIGYVMMSGGEMAGHPYSLYHSFDIDSVEFEGGMPVAAAMEETETIKVSGIPGGKAAFALHVGPYEKLEETWKALEAWLDESDHERADLCWEYYLSNPVEEPDPAQWKTELYWLLK